MTVAGGDGLLPSREKNLNEEREGRQEGEPPIREDLPPTGFTFLSELLMALSGNSL